MSGKRNIRSLSKDRTTIRSKVESRTCDTYYYVGQHDQFQEIIYSEENERTLNWEPIYNENSHSFHRS